MRCNAVKQQAELLKETEPEKSADIDSKRERIEEKFSQIKQPLEDKKKELQQQKRVFQFMRDCDDEHVTSFPRISGCATRWPPSRSPTCSSSVVS